MKPTWALEVLRQQHRAIDMLLAQRAVLAPTFYPSKSGPIWEAVVLGFNAIQQLEAEINGEPFFRCPACQAISHHPKDIEHGYCGRCHDFTGAEKRKMSE